MSILSPRSLNLPSSTDRRGSLNKSNHPSQSHSHSHGRHESLPSITLATPTNSTHPTKTDQHVNKNHASINHANITTVMEPIRLTADDRIFQPLESCGRESLQVALRTERGLQPTEQMNATFARIYTAIPSNANPHHMHTELIEPLLMSAFRGFNSNIISTGVPTVGKSRSMWGQMWNDYEPTLVAAVEDKENNNGEDYTSTLKDDGIADYILCRLFDELKHEERLSDASHVVALSLFGITPLDGLVDCFANSTGNGGTIPPGSGSSSTASTGAVLKLQENAAGKLVFAGLVKKLITSKNHGMRLLASVITDRIHEFRHHHLVAVLTLEKKDNQTGEITSSQLKLLDLAQLSIESEPDESGAMRRIFNPSMVTLNKVVNLLSKPVDQSTTNSSAMPNGSPRHVPYRESKLTRILKDGVGSTHSQTHSLFVINLAADMDEMNHQACQFGEKLLCISNTIMPETTLVDPAQSLHLARDRLQHRMKTRNSMVSGSPVVPVTPTRRISDVHGSPMSMRGSGVRRQLFEDNLMSPVPSTPRSARRHTVHVPKSSPRSAAPMVTLEPINDSTAPPTPVTMTTIDDSVIMSPLNTSTRRWKIGSAKPNAPSQQQAFNQTLNESFTSPNSSRRWTFKSKMTALNQSTNATPSRSSSSVSNKLDTLTQARLLLERRIRESTEMLEELAFKQMELERNTKTNRSAVDIEEAANLMARESAIMSQSELLRGELATIEAEISSHELGLNTDNEEESNIDPSDETAILPPAATIDERVVPNSIIVTAESNQAPVDESVPALVPISAPEGGDHASNAAVADQASLQILDVSRLSIVNETTEMCEDTIDFIDQAFGNNSIGIQELETSSVPYTPFTPMIPYGVKALSPVIDDSVCHDDDGEVHDDALSAGTAAAFLHAAANHDDGVPGPSSPSLTCSATGLGPLAGIMRRSLVLPRTLRPIPPPSEEVLEASVATATPITAPNAFPSSIAQINVVNISFNQSPSLNGSCDTNTSAISSLDAPPSASMAPSHSNSTDSHPILTRSHVSSSDSYVAPPRSPPHLPSYPPSKSDSHVKKSSSSWCCCGGGDDAVPDSLTSPLIEDQTNQSNYHTHSNQQHHQRKKGKSGCAIQ